MQPSTSVRHPAKATDAIMAAADELLAGILKRHALVYDPFAGVGKWVDHLCEQGYAAFGTEIELEWAAQSQHVECFDSLVYMRTMSPVDAVVTSPTYANRMADHHEARDGSRRNTYRHSLGRPLSPGSSAGLQWGDSYRAFHVKAWEAVFAVLRSGGHFLLNVKDHIRGGQQQLVSDWHLRTCRDIGFILEQAVYVPTPSHRHGANHQARVSGEWLLLFHKP